MQKATYYQFLKGAYFDTALELLSKWPRASLETLSVIQDSLDPSMAPTKQFAQPFVFFRLDPISALAEAPYVSTVANLRFRIPSRQIARYLSAYETILPSVELLDISTTNVTESELDKLLSRLARLKYLVMDACPIISQRADALEAEGNEELRQWASLGSTLAEATITRAKWREGRHKAWFHAQFMNPKEMLVPCSDGKLPTGKRGRKGLAAATISIRSQPATSVLQTSLPSLSGSSTLVSSAESLPERIHVIPPLPTLRAFAITAPMVSPDSPDFEANCVKIQQEFERGWSQGMHKISATYTRLRTHWARLKLTVFKMTPKERDALGVNYDLIPVESMEDFEFTPTPCPTLCIAGSGKGARHPEGCPHRHAWAAWKDDL